MELFRSVDMKYVAVTMTNEAAHNTVRYIGAVGQLDVVDLSAVERTGQTSVQHAQYKRRVQDILTIERRLGLIKDHVVNAGLILPRDAPIHAIHSAHADVVEAAAAMLLPFEEELTRNVTFQRSNDDDIAALIERRAVLDALKASQPPAPSARSRTTGAVLSRKGLLDGGDDDDVDDGGDNGSTDLGIGGTSGESMSPSSALASDSESRLQQTIVGTIDAAQRVIFARMLYRVTRGNAIDTYTALTLYTAKAATGNTKAADSPSKLLFTVVVIGQQLAHRVRRMCDSVKAVVYNLPADRAQWSNEIRRVDAEIKEKRDVQASTAQNISTLLSRLVDGIGDDGMTTCPIRDWMAALSAERVIAMTMMKAHFYLTMITIEGWVPSQYVQDVKAACKAAVQNTGNPPAALETEPANPIRIPASPPTFFPTDKFTETFQGIVDTYGVPRYKEANPGLFTIISFPFLFGVMYGDIGHGCALTLFAIFLIYHEDRLEHMQRRKTLGEIPSMAFGGRYVLLLMGMFAIYCGVIYNDCLSIPINLYGSSWTLTNNGSAPYTYSGATYPLGVDPVWAHKTNELAFYNSLKMKMAVILGVTQMIFGILLSLSNHLFFSDWISVKYEFIPRMTFMLCTFGYMCFMILYKWTVDWTGQYAPNLITTMINMFLSVGYVDPTKQLYPGQAVFQTLLVVLAFLSVPVLLFAKPYAHKALHAKKAAAYHYAGEHDDPNSIGKADADEDQADIEADDDEKEDGGEDDHTSDRIIGGMALSDEMNNEMSNVEHADFNFTDELIHNAIHTIEFVLGCVSNTASYLRLWALSLAHAELAGVFWDKMIQQYGIENNGFMAFGGFAVWFGATVAVLLAMDVLECFLHALRLHWVEFQNKFFYADGKAFEPFRFESTDALYV